MSTTIGNAVSVFANEAEQLTDRKVAANALGLILAALPESEVQGPVRTARIKCELAAKHSQTHSEVSDHFCAVSDLLYRGSVSL
ncbi:hypothetical protein SSTU70S_05703 [Stutzerimonas stutzeri]